MALSEVVGLFRGQMKLLILYPRAAGLVILAVAFAIASALATRVEEHNQRMKAQSPATGRLIERLRALESTVGGMLQPSSASRELPSMLLANGDCLFLQSNPTRVGVFGNVYNTGSYVHIRGRESDGYLGLPGGSTKSADEASAFVVRANGQVLSSRQRKTSWLPAGNTPATERGRTGAAIFILEQIDKSTRRQTATDWTQIPYQFGLGISAVASAVK